MTPSPPVHHLCYDDCLEGKSDNYPNCSVLCRVRHLCTHEQFLKLGVGLGLVFVHLFRFSTLCVFLV